MIASINKNTKIILDVDTGVDDALAIILLYNLFPKNILGITTCGGNVGIKQTTRNTLAILSLLKADIPVFKGSTKPLERKSYIPAFDYHGKNGLAEIDLPVVFKTKKENAISFISKSIKKYKNNLIIISIAPPTNLAKAFNKSKEYTSQIKAIYLMGGAFNVLGNQTKEAEFNFFQDPEAVRSVLGAGAPVFIIPLDVTNKCLIKKSDLKNIFQNKTGSFISNLIKNWYKIFGDKKNRYFELYDPLTISVLARKSLFSFKKSSIDIETRGRNRGGIKKGNLKVKYAYSIKSDTFLKFFFKNI